MAISAGRWLVHPHRHHVRKRRRTLRDKQAYFFTGILLVLILALVVAIFWAMSSWEMLKPR